MRKNLPSPTSPAALALSGALIVAGSVLTAPASAAAEPADDEEVTRVEEFAAVVDGDRVTVNGRAAFVDVPVMVGQDPVGDGFKVSVLGIAGGDTAAAAEVLGADLTIAIIARPDPFAETLTFTIHFANPPAVAQEPTPVTFHWGISLLGAPMMDQFNRLHYTLEAARSGHLVHPGSRDPAFRLIRGSYSTRINLFRSHSSFEKYVTGMVTLADLQGFVTDTAIQWHLPFELIEAKAGSVILSYGVPAVSSRAGLLGGPQELQLDSMTGELHRDFGCDRDPDCDMARYTVPDPTVYIGISPAGTPVGDVVLTMNADVESSGTFSGNLATPQEPGEYIVATRACYGDNNCDTATTNVTVP